MVYRQTKHVYDLNAPQVAKFISEKIIRKQKAYQSSKQAKLNSGIRTQKFCNKH
jgi:hypothetical protein